MSVLNRVQRSVRRVAHSIRYAVPASNTVANNAPQTSGGTSTSGQETPVKVVEPGACTVSSGDGIHWKPGEAVRVAFVAQHPSIWPSWRSVWQAMDRDPRFVVKVVLAPFIHAASSTSVTLDNMRRCLMEEGVSFCPSEYFVLGDFQPHIVFLQNPYDETRPQPFQSAEVAAAGAGVAYIPYGLEMGGGAWNLRAQFDLPFHRNAWRIFARSQRHRTMYGKYCSTGNSHVVVTGHPKFDAFHLGPQASLGADLISKIDGRTVVLWTPHFSVGDPPTWSTYGLYHQAIFAAMEKRQDLFLLLRPHPLFYKSMRTHGHWDADGEQEFRRRINESPNIALDEQSDYHPAFAASRALMADVGSFLLEYLPTGNPLLYLHHSDGLGMNDDGELVEYLYRATCAADIEKFLDMVRSGADPLRATREEKLGEFLVGLDSHIGETICEHIYSAVSRGDTWRPRYDRNVHTEHARSHQYWVKANYTYLAPPDCYECKERVLNQVLDALPPIGKAIDVGCGDGSVTLKLAKYAQKVVGYDVSRRLIDQARNNAAEQGITHVEFIAQELDDVRPLERFDLVSCLGVTSCLIDDFVFLACLNHLRALAQSNAYLLLIDSLSIAAERIADNDSGYIAKYRAEQDYLLMVKQAGFDLQEAITIKEAPESKLINKLFIFRAV